MPVDVGRVFSDSWAITKERFWLLLGMWAVFFVLQIAVSGILATVMGGSMMALIGAAGAGGGIDDTGGLLAGGLGIGFVAITLISNVATIVIALAQQCAMAALATPLHRSNFGEAFQISFKGGLTFLAITILLVIIALVLSIGFALAVALLSVMGSAGGVIGALLLFPLSLYLMMRMCVIVPVVAVDQVLNPIKAITTTWRITSGRMVGILLVTLAWIALTLLVMGIPMALIVAPILAIESGAGDAAMMGAFGSILIAMLIFFPLFIVYSVISVVINASLHAQLSDNHTQNLEETFA